MTSVASTLRRPATARVVKLVVLVAVAVVLFVVPYTWFPSFGILPDYTGAAGSLSMLSKVFILAALAVTFDLLLGQSGLMSFGHVLYFAMGSYVFAMLLVQTDVAFWPAALLTVLVVALASAVLSAVALRVEGIAYSMVTLAFAQVGAVIVARNYFDSGGEDGLRLPSAKVPSTLLGLANVANVYWLSLVVLVVVIAIAALVVHSRFGLALRGVRENQLRMRVLGYNVYLLRLAVSVVSCTLAGICGIVYAVVLGGTDPGAVGLVFALALIFMVVIGGSGSLVGAAVGGTIYALLDYRLPALSQSLEGSNAPAWIGKTLGEPDLILGLVFLVVVFAAPQGLVGAVTSRGRRSAAPEGLVVEDVTDVPDRVNAHSR